MKKLRSSRLGSKIFVRKQILRDHGGFALLLTMLIISTIVPLTLQFQSSMRSELDGAVNLQDGIGLDQTAKSGFHFALAVLYEDALASEFDSPLEDWANLTDLGANTASMFEQGRFEVRIRDESGKIQINSLIYHDGKKKGQYNPKQKDLLSRFLSSEEFDLDQEEIDNIIDAFKDWIDQDDEVTKFGAENSYYQSLEEPYDCKNAPFEFVEELQLVRGVTRELFYGTDEQPGISTFLNTHGGGTLNINTADPLVLKSLSVHMDPEMIEAMVQYREDDENDLSKPGWYKTVPGMSSEVSIDDLITTSSSHFEIESLAFRGAQRKRVKGLVQRDEGALTILSWSVE